MRDILGQDHEAIENFEVKKGSLRERVTKKIVGSNQNQFRFSKKRGVKDIEYLDENEDNILNLITQSNKVTQSLNSAQDISHASDKQVSQVNPFSNKTSKESEKNDIDNLCINFS